MLLGLVRVPYRTFPQRKEHGASHFVGVDKGNKFMWLFRITQTHDGGLKCVPKPVRDVSDSVILLQASFGHEMAGILYSSHVCAVSKWACFFTHTSNHATSHLLCLKN